MKVCTLTVGVVAVLALAVAAGAENKEAAEKAKDAKPAVSCEQLVETYKKNNSVDETSSMYLVDQSRVAQCLKAAGITAPAEDDE